MIDLRDVPRRSTSVHRRKKVLGGASYFYSVGSAHQISKQTTVPSLYGMGETSQHSNTALRAASARPQAPIHAHPRTSALAREGSRRSRYCFTVSVERVESLNERLSHHCVVRGQRPNTQTPPYGPRARVPKLRYMLVHAPRRVARRALGGAVILYSVR